MTKYRAQKTACAAGHTHDSKLEAGRCDDLHALQTAGQIERLTFQPEFPIIINGRPVFKYVADFAYFTSQCRIVEDVKGMITPVYRLKKKVVEACNPGCVITEWPVRTRKKRKLRKAA